MTMPAWVKHLDTLSKRAFFWRWAMAGGSGQGRPCIDKKRFESGGPLYVRAAVHSLVPKEARVIARNARGYGCLARVIQRPNSRMGDRFIYDIWLSPKDPRNEDAMDYIETFLFERGD